MPGYILKFLIWKPINTVLCTYTSPSWLSLVEFICIKPTLRETRNMEEEKSIQPPTYGNLVTILSIDGGGIRGIIPAVVLAFLESELQVRL